MDVEDRTRPLDQQNRLPTKDGRAVFRWQGASPVRMLALTIN